MVEGYKSEQTVWKFYQSSVAEVVRSSMLGQGVMWDTDGEIS